MNRSLLNQLQQLRSYPSVTILMNTTRGSVLSGEELTNARKAVADVDRRLTGEIDDVVLGNLVDRLNRLLDQRSRTRSGRALALCVSRDIEVAVQLGVEVDERTIIDETFATRDLVADLNRTATFRVVTVSDATTRVLLGDRQRLVEQRDDDWPLVRAEDVSDTVWAHEVTERLRALDADHALPVVAAGVRRSIARLLGAAEMEMIGEVHGNHDRSNASTLHTLSWPLVLDWIATGQQRAIEQLDAARSSRRFAAGIDEIWPLANEGRVDLLVIEEGYSLSARIDDNGHLHPTSDDHRDVTADVIDEAIEAVVQRGGEAVLVADDSLADEGRIAAALRF